MAENRTPGEGTMTEIFHSGELEVQALAGVQDIASRVGQSIRSTISPAARDFLRSQPVAILGSIDAVGRVWASLLSGEPGFMQAVSEQALQIKACPFPGDPIKENLMRNDHVGMIVIEFATRRRMRLNGRAEVLSEGSIYIHTSQVYTNCPKYIRARGWEKTAAHPGTPPIIKRTSHLSSDMRRLIERSDTFFIASSHPESGVDASHRGGPPGFIHILKENLLAWPDFSGNKMFQTLGNISVNPNAGLLFIDFKRGGTLQLTGKSRIVWEVDSAMEMAGAERMVEFQIDEAIEITGVNMPRWEIVDNIIWG